MNIQQISINDLKPYPQNAKKHPAEQVEHIANSIRGIWISTADCG